MADFGEAFIMKALQATLVTPRLYKQTRWSFLRVVFMDIACDPLDHTSIYQRANEDSDESDGEGGLGNVNRVIVRPPGHSGKAKRGHLCFDASFETGNLGRVDLINEYEYDLYIRPDTCSPRLRFWFNFTVDNVKQDQRVIFNIVNISKSRNLFNTRMTPIVKSTSRPKWQRIPKHNVYYQRSPVHQNNYILSFLFGFDKEDEIFQFALAHPYSYSRLQTFLTTLDTKGSQLESAFKRELLGNSVQKRKVDLISVGLPDKVKTDAKRRVIIIMVRTHPGESPSSYVCQGLLEYLISSHTVPSLLRDHVTFKVIPMLNPDGVFLGNYRSTLMGFDLNRSWNIISPWAHPTLKAAIDMIVSIDKSKDFQLDFVVDVHAHSSLTGCFIFGNSYEDVYRYERHIVFPKMLAGVADDYVPNHTMFNSDTNKVGSARRYLCTILSKQVNCYTFEVSLYGYRLKGSDVVIPYTEDSYMRCGRNLIRAFLEYYQVTNVIPIELPSSVAKKKKQPRSHRSRSTTRTSYRTRPNTTRTQALLHFKELNMNYDSETSVEEYPSTFRYYGSPPRISERESPKKIGGGGLISKFSAGIGSPPPATYVVIPEPSLSIIDFNIITRHGLEEACKRNKHVV